MHKWDTLGVPHRGWTCIDVHDLEDAVHTCEMCRRESIRYVHLMCHPDHPGPLHVGCICAEKMAVGYDGKAAERNLRNRASRRSAFISRGWRTSMRGHSYKEKDGILVVVGQSRYGYWASVAGEFLAGKFATEQAAKLAAFDAVDANCGPASTQS